MLGLRNTPIKIIPQRFILQLVAIAASSLLISLSFPVPGKSSGVLAWIAFTPILYVFSKRDWKNIFWALIWMLLTSFITFRGLTGASADYFGIPYPQMFMTVVLFSFVWWGNWILFALLLRKFKDPKWQILWIPALWVILEFLFGKTSPQARALTLALTQVDLDFLTPLAQWAGGAGLSFWTMACNVSLYQALRNRGRKKSLIPVAILGFLGVILGFINGRFSFTSHQSSWPVALIQPNVSRGIHWEEASYQELVKTLKAKTLEAHDRGAKLIFWPSNALYLTGEDRVRSLFSSFDTLRDDSQIAFGATVRTLREGQDRLYNMILLANSRGDVEEVYAKKRLTPFTEYLPSFCPDVLGRAHFAHHTITRSHEGYTVFKTGPMMWSSLICVEVLYPDLIRRFIQEGARTLVVFSNDNLYGSSYMPDYLLATAQLRAKEFGLPVIRETLNGISAVIDRTGHIMKKTSYPSEDILLYDFDLVGQPTFYARYGDVFSWGITCIFVCALMTRLFRHIRRLRDHKHMV